MAGRTKSRSRLAWLAGALGAGLVLAGSPALGGPSPTSGLEAAPLVSGGIPGLAPILVILLGFLLAGLVGEPPSEAPAALPTDEAGGRSGRRSEPDGNGVYRAVLDALEEGVLILEPEEGGRLRVRESNRAAADLLGEDQASLIGRRLEDLLGGLPKNGVLNQTEALLSREGPAFLEAVHGGGLIQGRLLKLPTNRVAAILKAGGREGVEDLVQALPVGVVVSGRDEKVSLLNPAAEEVTGWKLEEALGRGLEEVVPLVDLKAAARSGSSSEARRLGVMVGPGEGLALLSRSGRSRTVSALSGPLHDGTGSWVGTVHVLQDKSRQGCLNEELERATKIESMALLAGGIAHDFNNLLAGISGNISLARLYAQPEQKLVEKLDMAQAAASRARDLTQQLISFARGGIRSPGAASLPELIKEAASFLIPGPRISLDFDLDPDLWPIRVDPSQMCQVLTNLLLNAEQAMPGGGVITISAENRRISSGEESRGHPWRHVLVSVSDQGEGIAQEHLGRIFDPFFTTKENGTGLGLATVYSIIRENEGYVFVDSEPGRGTTFYLLIPASEKKEEEGFDPADRSPDPAPEAPRVLLMDDDKMVRETAAELLANLGYRVEAVQDGSQAVELFFRAREQGRPFSGLVMDLHVPGGMGGLEAIRRIRRVDSRVWAVISSGHGDLPDLTGCRIYGPQALLVKPYRLEELKRVMARVSGRRPEAGTG